MALKADLKANRPISEADEEWLDNAGNLVDHELVVQELEMASDYEAAYEALDLQHKSIVQKLAMSGEKSVVPSKKRKCMDLKVWFRMYWIWHRSKPKWTASKHSC